jgi:hypothetical protein
MGFSLKNAASSATSPVLEDKNFNPSLIKSETD